MEIQSLTLRGFRNYADEHIDFDPGINVISGPNAQGKTNLLEAVYLLTGTRSFRVRTDSELIGFNEQFAQIEAKIHSQGRAQTVTMLMRPKIRKAITCNGSKITQTQLSEKLKAVLFCPDDLNLIREGPAIRRKLMDDAISQLKPGYAALLGEYNRLYASKMKILKAYQDDSAMLQTLPEFSDALYRLSAKIIRYRASFVRRLEDMASPIHESFSGTGEKLSVRYKTVSTVADPTAPETQIYSDILKHAETHHHAELATASCLTGAHKDDLIIDINGQNARSFASQGQTRTAALSIKMAERELFLQLTGEPPVLLLDDVLSELDASRQAFVLNRIGGGQTLITCCEDDQISRRTGGRVFMVSAGSVTQLQTETQVPEA